MDGEQMDERINLEREVRRQFAAPATRRFLRALPAFRVDSTMPPRFHDLLAALDRAEQSSDAG